MSKIDDAFLEQVLNVLHHPQVFVDSLTWERFDNPFPISPSKFLHFARQDLQTDLEHRYVNALSNTKRALDCQVDGLLSALCMLDICKRNRWGFPQKLKTIQTLQMTAPDILNRINRSRNLLEHEFDQPDPIAVTDALDTVALFVAYTTIVLHRFPYEADIFIDDPEYPYQQDGVSFKFDRQTRQLEAGLGAGGNSIQVVLTPEDREYLPLFGKIIQTCLTN